MERKTAARGGLRLTNTLSRSKERFESRQAGRVKLFTCGPSIYSRPHIGNYRTFLFEDILLRYLEYRGYAVERVINLTDVEDKTLKAAAREGMSLGELTDPIAERFRREAAMLGIKLPPTIPRSSTSVDEAVRLIEILIDKGHAYWHRGDVFFDPLTYRGFGRLAGLDMRRWPKRKVRFRRDTYPGQRWNLGDFILWHGRCDDEAGFCWQTAIGRGRPAWNIQDPAIITKHLGERIDIACGGIDNLVRHHDYNLAVVEAATGKPFCPYWLHCEHVLVDGVKMSKSRGNIVYPDDLLARGLDPAHIRFFLIDGHYRRRIHLDNAKLAAARDRLDRLRADAAVFAGRPGRGAARTDGRVAGLVDTLVERFEAAMDDDLDVGRALRRLEQTLARLVRHRRQGRLSDRDCRRVAEGLLRIDGVLRVLFA